MRTINSLLIAAVKLSICSGCCQWINDYLFAPDLVEEMQGAGFDMNQGPEEVIVEMRDDDAAVLPEEKPADPEMAESLIVNGSKWFRERSETRFEDRADTRVCCNVEEINDSDGGTSEVVVEIAAGDAGVPPEAKNVDLLSPQIARKLLFAGSVELKWEAKRFRERSEMTFKDSAERISSWTAFGRIIDDVVESSEFGRELLALSGFFKDYSFDKVADDTAFFCILGLRMSGYVRINPLRYEGFCEDPRRDQFARLIDFAKTIGLSTREILNAHSRLDAANMEQLLSFSGEEESSHVMKSLSRSEHYCQRGVDYLDRFIDLVSDVEIEMILGVTGGFTAGLRAACEVDPEESIKFQVKFDVLSDCMQAVLGTNSDFKVTWLRFMSELMERFALEMGQEGGDEKIIQIDWLISKRAHFLSHKIENPRIFGFTAASLPALISAKLKTFMSLPCWDEKTADLLMAAIIEISVDWSKYNLIALADVLEQPRAARVEGLNISAFSALVCIFEIFGVSVWRFAGNHQDLQVDRLISAITVLHIDGNKLKRIGEIIEIKGENWLQRVEPVLTRMALKKIDLLAQTIVQHTPLIDPYDVIDYLTRGGIHTEFARFSEEVPVPLYLELRHILKLPVSICLWISEFLTEFPTWSIYASMISSKLFPTPGHLLRRSLRYSLLNRPHSQCERHLIQSCVLKYLELVDTIEKRGSVPDRSKVYLAVAKPQFDRLMQCFNSGTFPEYDAQVVENEIQTATQELKQGRVPEYDCTDLTF
jgi:hypothetical protein